MSKEGGNVKRFVLEGTDYVYPRTSNKIIRAYLKFKGVADEDIRENYTPFGFSDWQTEVSAMAIKKFGAAGKATAVISTINGDANVPFYKELGNQGVAATDIPVIAFSVGEEELKGLDTKPLVGHLAAWSYFQSVDTPENKAFIEKWHAYTHDPKRVTNDPMESAYILFNMWAQAVKKAGTTDVDAVRKAIIGQTVVSPTRIQGRDECQSPRDQAGNDRRDSRRRPVRHRLPEQADGPESLEPVPAGKQEARRCKLMTCGDGHRPSPRVAPSPSRCRNNACRRSYLCPSRASASNWTPHQVPP